MNWRSQWMNWCLALLIVGCLGVLAGRLLTTWGDGHGMEAPVSTAQVVVALVTCSGGEVLTPDY